MSPQLLALKSMLHNADCAKLTPMERMALSNLLAWQSYWLSPQRCQFVNSSLISNSVGAVNYPPFPYHNESVWN